jgi:hypothetical protein
MFEHIAQEKVFKGSWLAFICLLLCTAVQVANGADTESQDKALCAFFAATDVGKYVEGCSCSKGVPDSEYCKLGFVGCEGDMVTSITLENQSLKGMWIIL